MKLRQEPALAESDMADADSEFDTEAVVAERELNGLLRSAIAQAISRAMQLLLLNAE
jgi:hypothetical protein